MFGTLISHVQKLKVITKHHTYNLHYIKSLAQVQLQLICLQHNTWMFFT